MFHELLVGSLLQTERPEVSMFMSLMNSFTNFIRFFFMVEFWSAKLRSDTYVYEVFLLGTSFWSCVGRDLYQQFPTQLLLSFSVQALRIIGHLWSWSSLFKRTGRDYYQRHNQLLMKSEQSIRNLLRIAMKECSARSSSRSADSSCVVRLHICLYTINVSNAVVQCSHLVTNPAHLGLDRWWSILEKNNITSNYFQC